MAHPSPAQLGGTEVVRRAHVVRALVNNVFVEGYQVAVEDVVHAPNGVTALSRTSTRQPANRALTREDADALCADLCATREGQVA